MPDTYIDSTGETRDKATGKNVNPPADTPAQAQADPSSAGAGALKPQSPLAQPDQSDIGRHEAGIAAAQKPYYDKLKTVLDSPQEATAHLEKVKDAPNPQDYHKYSMEFASAMAVIGAIGGRFTRHGGTIALNAYGAALKGWQAGNVQAYEEASKQWEQATKQTIENNNVELEKYHEILENKKANIEQMMAGITIASSEYQNKVIFDMAKSGNFNAVAQAVDKMGQANQRLQGAFGELTGLRKEQWADTESKIDLLNNDSQLNAQMKATQPKEWLALAAAGHARGKELNQPPEGIGTGSESENTLDADAERYRQTGTLPPNMGRGIQGQGLASAIRDRAAQLEVQSGGNTKDWPAKWQQYKAQGVGYNTEQGAIGRRAGNVDIFVNEADKAIPIVRKLAEQNAGKGIATWDAIQGRWEVEKGDRGFANYTTQLNTLAGLYGRIVTGGAAGAVSDREYMRKYLNPNMPLSAVEGSLDGYKTEVQIAQEAPGEVRQAIQKRNQGGGAAVPSGGVNAPLPGGDDSGVIKYDAQGNRVQ